LSYEEQKREIKQELICIAKINNEILKNKYQNEQNRQKKIHERN
tara:strand:- start:13341 stop:13472 length:132 start_codon:yes stop_codon:yes gene_type:complete